MLSVRPVFCFLVMFYLKKNRVPYLHCIFITYLFVARKLENCEQLNFRTLFITV